MTEVYANIYVYIRCIDVYQFMGPEIYINVYLIDVLMIRYHKESYNQCNNVSYSILDYIRY